MESQEFMLIFMGVDYGEMQLSPEEIQKKAKEWMDWQAQMMEKGIISSGNGLQAQLTRITGPDRTESDRMGVASKEIVGGYYIIKAFSVEEAKSIAMDYPDFDLGGSVEIREFVYYN